MNCEGNSPYKTRKGKGKEIYVWWWNLGEVMEIRKDDWLIVKAGRLAATNQQNGILY